MWIVSPIIIAIFILLRLSFSKKNKLQNVFLDQTEFRRLFLQGFLVFIPSAIGGGFVMHFLLEKIYVFETDGNEMILHAGKGIKTMCTLLFAFFFSIFSLIVYCNYRLKERSEAFWNSYDLRYGFPASKILRFLCVVFGIAYWLLLLLGRNSYIKIKEDNLISSQMLTFSETITPVKNIQEINFIMIQEMNDEGKLMDKSYYEIILDDGVILNNKMGLRSKQEGDHKFFDHLSQISGKEINVRFPL